MKHYKMTKEEKDHFVMHDKRDGKSFKVAKTGLSDAHQLKVRKMSDGGGVGTNDPMQNQFGKYAGIFQASAAADPVEAAQPLNNSPLGRIINGQAGPDVTAPPVYAAGQGPENQAANAAGSGQGTAEVLPPAVNPNTAAIDGAGGMQQASYETPAADSASALRNIAADNDKIIGDEVKALHASSAAAQTAANQQAKIAQDYQTQVQALQLKQQDQYAALDKEQEAIKQDIAGSKIDPHRLWNNAGTGNKVLAGIGVLLSGIGSGLAGGPNLAMQVLQKTIDQDIDAQKAELGKKENLLAQNLRRYGDVNTATAATAMQLNSVMQAQIAGQAAKVGSAIAQQQATSAIGQLQMQNNAYKQQLSTQAVKAQILDQGGSQGMTPGVAEQVAPGRWLNTPAGIKFAKTPEEAKKLSELTATAQTLDGQINEMMSFAKNEGTTFPGSTSSAVANGMQKSLTLGLKDYYSLGQISVGDQALLDALVPDPGALRSTKTIAQLSRLKTELKAKLNANYAAHLVNPAGLGPAPTAGQDQSTGLSLTNWRK